MQALTEPTHVIKDALQRSLGRSVPYSHVQCVLAPLLGYRFKEGLSDVNALFAEFPGSPSPCLVLQPGQALKGIEQYFDVPATDRHGVVEVLRLMKDALELLAPGRVFDNDDAFVAWYERTHLQVALRGIDAVRKAASFCGAPCTAFVDDSIGIDQLAPLAEQYGQQYWSQNSAGQMCPLDPHGRPVGTLDYVGVFATVAYHRLGAGSIIEPRYSMPTSVVAWATRHDSGMGGIALSGTFRWRLGE